MSALDTGGVMFEHFRKRNEKQKQLTAYGQEASQRAVFILLPVTNAIHLSTAFSPSQTYFT